MVDKIQGISLHNERLFFVEVMGVMDSRRTVPLISGAEAAIIPEVQQWKLNSTGRIIKNGFRKSKNSVS